MRRFIAVLLAAPLLVVPATAPASAACARVPSDFNGDGFGDLAVGAHDRKEPTYSVPWQGAVNIAYGSAAGIGKGSLGSMTFDGTPESVGRGFDGSSRLGESLATGYFDGDCYADLAVSAASASKFLLLYGSAAGLTKSRAAGFDRTAIQPNGAYPSGFSEDLAAGDFNGDGFDDIAAGAPWAEDNRGGLGVLYGSDQGISATGGQWIDQDSPGVPGAAEPGDVFGRSLTAGDFNGDGRDELVAGAPGEALGSRYDAGGIVVFPGTAAGVSTVGSTWWDQNSPGVPGAAESNDRFGHTLTAGDTGVDGRDELIVASDEGVGSKGWAGAVHVFHGSASGLRPGAMFTQDDAAIPGASESGDYFGSALALVDFNRDGKRDLVIGVMGETVGSTYSSGAVNVLFSAAAGPVAAGSIYLDQNSAGVPGANETSDRFGGGLSRLVNAYGGESLVIGVSGETVTYTSEGAVVVLPGAAVGKTRPNGYFFSGSNFPGRASAEANFGRGLPS
ncbi:FG-GAP repeat protein [Actinoplanes sichuanensis]|uniref:FG-GAP repeat protein n=1 Tax=Actinoplanes sichuanensis TaxID=512349 RepID=A0ABW4A458_9ACTN|nr:FG-GAP repeat protein [Actinoplanes sichuanensis]